MHLCSEHNQTKKAFISSKKCHLSIFLHAFQMLLLKKDSARKSTIEIAFYLEQLCTLTVSVCAG